MKCYTMVIHYPESVYLVAQMTVLCFRVQFVAVCLPLKLKSPYVDGETLASGQDIHTRAKSVY